MNKKTVKVILGILITVILVYFLIVQIKLDDILILFRKISLFWFLMGFILYSSSYLARAVRFKIILGVKLSLKRLFEIVGVHTMMNNILPARTGELSYVYLLRKEHITGSKSASSLILARIFDLIIIILIFLGSLFFLDETPKIISSSLFIISLFLLLVIVFLFLLILFGGKAVILGNKIFYKLKINRFKIATKISGIVKDIILGFKSVESKRKVFLIFIVSAIIWLLQYFTFYLIMVSVGITIPLVFLIISITFRNMSNILPITGIGGFGIIEGSWALGLLMFGISKEIAISTAFFSHIVIIIYFLIIGSYSLVRINKSKNI